MSADYHDHDDHHPSPWGPHDWGHGAPHNSFAPLILAIGVGLLLLMFGGLFSFGEYDGSYLPMVFVGLAVIAAAFIVW